MDYFTTVKDKFINDVSREERQVISHYSFFLFGQGGGIYILALTSYSVYQKKF